MVEPMEEQVEPITKVDASRAESKKNTFLFVRKRFKVWIFKIFT
jgi:hypothetical protein